MEKKLVEKIKNNFNIPNSIRMLMSNPPKKVGPQWYIFKTMWESQSIT